MADDALRLETLEHPSVADEQPLDRRVPLKRRHRIVEQLGRGCARVPGRIDAELVRRVVVVQSELADDGVGVAPEGPSQDSDFTAGGRNR